MDVFNIIVGVFSIIGSIASLVSVFYLHSISMHQRSSGDNSSNQMQINRGKNNTNTITTGN